MSEYSGVIKLNEGNPINLPCFRFTTFNHVYQVNLTRYFNVELGDQVDFKVVYDYLINEGYAPVTMQLTAENIAHIKAGEEPYTTNYHEQYYALAGGITGGWLTCYDSTGKIYFYFLSETSVYSSTGVIPTYTYDNTSYNRKCYYVDNMLYNGQPMRRNHRG